MRYVTQILSGSSGRRAAEGIGGFAPDREGHSRLGGSARRGFTLVELLVVMGILLLVAAVTLSAINMNLSGDRIRGAARQIQSYLEGARGRAAYGGNATTRGATYQCGVRFIRDSNDQSDPKFNLCSSIQFVEIDSEKGGISGGVFGIQYDGGQPKPTILRGTDNNAPGSDESKTHWYDRYQQGLIFDFQTILLDNRRYQIRTTDLAPNNEVLKLVTPYTGTTLYSSPGDPGGFAVPKSNQPKYRLLLPPQPMANQEPRLLGNGVVLDLTLSKGLQYYTSYQLPVDVMFSPRGTVIGPLAGTGVVEFVLSDRQDALLRAPISSNFWQAKSYSLYEAVAPSSGRGTFIYQVVSISGSPPTSGPSEPTWPTVDGQTVVDGNLTWKCLATSDGCSSAKQERLIVRLSPQTGSTAVHPVYVSRATEDGDPYRYAETGEVAAQ